jgi:hypothetical protein
MRIVHVFAAVHGAVDAARVRVLPGKAQIPAVIEIGDVEWRVQALDGLARRGHELSAPLGKAGQRALQRRLFPLLLGSFISDSFSLSNIGQTPPVIVDCTDGATLDR